MYGPAARASRAVHLRLWGTDPFTRGYVTQWWPGDVMRVGPLHGTHDPPFYVCGSDPHHASGPPLRDIAARQ